MAPRATIPHQTEAEQERHFVAQRDRPPQGILEHPIAEPAEESADDGGRRSQRCLPGHGRLPPTLNAKPSANGSLMRSQATEKRWASNRDCNASRCPAPKCVSKKTADVAGRSGRQAGSTSSSAPSMSTFRR